MIDGNILYVPVTRNKLYVPVTRNKLYVHVTRNKLYVHVRKLAEILKTKTNVKKEKTNNAIISNLNSRKALRKEPFSIGIKAVVVFAHFAKLSQGAHSNRSSFEWALI